WTGSRSAWISAAAGMFVVLLFQFFKIKNKPIFSLGLISILFVFISAFLLLPTTVRNTVLVRFFPNLDLPTTVKLEGAYRFRTGSFVSFLRHEPLSIIWPIQVPSASVGFRDGRFDVWQKYTEEFIRNPLGLGLNYASVIYQDNISGQSVNAHNVLLQVALSGGVGGFFVFLFILWKAGKGLYKYARENYSALILALTGVFSGMIVNTMFFDALEIRWFWIILGLAIVVPTSRISSDKEVVVK
ncbi:O-antigen ligase family protein, partial [Candidatus Jorgensenbacteria bacterium]|nr:O-antigen ligase family protein [Candidatus Jorgensenbacteria bacterium]